MIATCCESDRHRPAYRLADGRHMCPVCRRRFRVGPRKSRLASVVQRELLQRFWQGDSAAASARHCRVNVKSAQRFFRRIRESIGRAASTPQASSNATASSPRPEMERRRVAVFGVREDVRSIQVLMPGEAMRLGGARNASISWIYAPTSEAASKLRLDAFFRIAAETEVRRWHGRAHVSRADSFWRFARERLKAYRGGYRYALGAYLKEMAFRFNARSHPDGGQLLLEAMGFEPL